jgi:hypothetical protein
MIGDQEWSEPTPGKNDFDVGQVRSTLNILPLRRFFSLRFVSVIGICIEKRGTLNEQGECG